MKLEGKLAGPFVDECRKAWLHLGPWLELKRFAMDLRGMTFVDEAGTQLLREMYSATEAEILSDTPLTKYFAEKARMKAGSHSTNGSKGA